jgi:hypothetical protein
MINLSRTKNNVIFIVFEKNTANQLIQCWSNKKSEFSIKLIQEDEIWFERIMHDVEIASFDNSMNKFQEKIVAYNDITFARESIWLTRVKKRENKTHSFIEINLRLKNEINKAIKINLIMFEKVLQMTKFLNNRIN